MCKEFSRIVCVSLFSYQGSLFFRNNSFILSQTVLLVKNFFQVFSSFFNLQNSKRRRRDLNPRAAINDLLPFQGSPFGQLGYFSKSPYAIASFFSEAFYIISRCFLFVKNFFNFSKVFYSLQIAERVGFEPTRPCGQTVFKTASL